MGIEQILYGDERAEDVRKDRSVFAAALDARKSLLWVKTTTGGFHPAGTDPATKLPIYDASTFVTSVSLAAGIYYQSGSEWIKDPKILVSGGCDVPEPDFSGAFIPGIDSIGEPLLAELTGISLHYAREIKKLGPVGSVVELDKKAADAGIGTKGMTAAILLVANAVVKSKLKWGK
jgi:hypothetical protein